jgi:hypothetical protein
MLKRWMSIFGVVDSTLGDDTFVTDNRSGSAKKYQEGKGDVEMTEIEDVRGDRLGMIEQRQHVPGMECPNGVAVHGVNRPYFHVDIDSAVKSALAFEEPNDDLERD